MIHNNNHVAKLWQLKDLAVLRGGRKGALRWIWRCDGGDFVARFDDKKKGIQAGALAEIGYFVEGALTGNTDFVGRDLADKMDFVARVFAENLYYVERAPVENFYSV